MLDCINAVFSIYKRFVQQLFNLPFYDGLSVGWLLVSILVMGCVVYFLIYRLK